VASALRLAYCCLALPTRTDEIRDLRCSQWLRGCCVMQPVHSGARRNCSTCPGDNALPRLAPAGSLRFSPFCHSRTGVVPCRRFRAAPAAGLQTLAYAAGLRTAGYSPPLLLRRVACAALGVPGVTCAAPHRTAHLRAAATRCCADLLPPRHHHAVSPGAVTCCNRSRSCGRFLLPGYASRTWFGGTGSAPTLETPCRCLCTTFTRRTCPATTCLRLPRPAFTLPSLPACLLPESSCKRHAPGRAPTSLRGVPLPRGRLPRGAGCAPPHRAPPRTPATLRCPPPTFYS